jgi:predicted lactoylglutathione lyase
VDEQQPEQSVEALSAQSRAEWIRPQVDRLVAGGAEAGGVSATDGIDILS